MKYSITEGALQLILHVSRNCYPNEFGGFLRGDNDLIKEVLLIPGTLQGEKSVLFRLQMLPIDRKIIGTVHSHPSASNQPSNADLQFFRKTGRVHLIVKNPYQDLDDIRAYDINGQRVDLNVESP